MFKKKKQQPELTPEEQRAQEIADRKKELMLKAIRSDRPEKKERKFLKPVVFVAAGLCIVLVFLLATFGFVGNTWFVKVNLDDPKFAESTYTEEVKQAAADAVIDFFHKEFNGSILHELDYSEKWSAKQGSISFTGEFYSIFSNNKIVEDTTRVKGNKWHWDVQPTADGGYEVKTYGLLKDVVDTSEDAAAEAEEPAE